jgi:hypothetical protein
MKGFSSSTSSLVLSNHCTSLIIGLKRSWCEPCRNEAFRPSSGVKAQIQLLLCLVDGDRFYWLLSTMAFYRKTPARVVSRCSYDIDETHFDLYVLLQCQVMWPRLSGADLPKDSFKAHVQDLRKTVMAALTRSLPNRSETSGAVARDILLDSREARASRLPSWTLYVHSHTVQSIA